MTAEVRDTRLCALGEGPIWHPGRRELFWFDILGNRLLSDDGKEWAFDRNVSAAGWVDDTSLLVATETDLAQLDLDSGTLTQIAALEDDLPATRSNDGRADPSGGFWIGTMGKDAQHGAGAIYRFYRGELRRLVSPVTIPNAICFPPDGAHAYYTDTAVGIVWRVSLDSHGWPDGEPQAFLDLGPDAGIDGAVVDTDGRFWNAQWGHYRVAVYAPDGTLLEVHPLPARQPSCPAFGGPDLSTL
ncbi:MAG: SMP-30/gluconolactonase/LRE family protein, partial [Pseudomonadota bacterium]